MEKEACISCLLIENELRWIFLLKNNLSECHRYDQRKEKLGDKRFAFSKEFRGKRMSKKFVKIRKNQDLLKEEHD